MKVDIKKDIKVNSVQMEEVEGITNEYPYTMHKIDMESIQIPWHWHEELEFTYIAKGKKQVLTTGHTYEFQEGEAFFTNSNALCAMKNIGKCKVESHLFHATFLSGHFRSIYETKYMNPVLQNKKIEVVAIRGTTENQKKILSKLRQASRLQEQENVEFQTRNLFSEIWLLLLDEIANSENLVMPKASMNKERLLTMMAFIQKNYSQKITLEEIAASASISAREASRCFQSSIHETAIEYLLECRVEMAKKLLKSSNLSMTEIAIKTGFSDSAYFGKIFRRKMKMTPLEYRKMSQV